MTLTTPQIHVQLLHHAGVARPRFRQTEEAENLKGWLLKTIEEEDFFFLEEGESSTYKDPGSILCRRPRVSLPFHSLPHGSGRD